MTIPSTIQDDAYNLTGAAQVMLYDLQLYNGSSIYLSPKGSYTWQGRAYEEVPCHMSSVGRQADGKLNRPKFTVVNPNGMFTTAIGDRSLEGALLTRHRLMKADLLADLNNALSQTFRISKVASVDRQVIVVECRGSLDGANFKLPYRAFYPPEFPHVGL